jgi:TolA-binding protein
MTKALTNNKKLLKQLQTELRVLQEKLAEAHKLEGKDAYIDVRVKKNQARFERIKQKGVEDKAIGKFYIEVNITAKQVAVFVPISIASGKKVAGFMYQIEGTAEGSLATTDIKVRGETVSQVTLGTLVYAKIPAKETASFQIQATIRGKFGKAYKIVFTRLNYKLQLADARYQQYLKEIHSDTVTFS